MIGIVNHMAMKPLSTEFQDKPIVLECKHKREFPPPQMYGHTAEDIDKMWKQGAIDQTLHQKLVIWKNMCGLFQMDAKCMGCEQALLQKPRPGRPHVIETENWLKAKRRLELEKQRANRILPEDRPVPAPLPEPTAPLQKPRIVSGNPNLGLVATKTQQEFEAATAEEADAMEELMAKMETEIEVTTVEELDAIEAKMESLRDSNPPIETPSVEEPKEDLEEDLISALVDD